MLAVFLKRYEILCLICLIIIGICICKRVYIQVCTSTVSLLQVMWNAAVHAEYLHDHSDYGFEVGNVRFSWE